MKKLFALLLAFSLVLTLCSCSGTTSTAPSAAQPAASGSAPASEPKEIEHPSSLVICASTMGGLWHNAAIKLSEVLMTEFPDMSVTVIEGTTDGNMNILQKGVDCTLGFTSSPGILDALAGTNPNVSDVSDIEVIGPVCGSVFQFGVLADTDIYEWTDLIGKDISSGGDGLMSKYIFEYIGEYYDFTIQDIIDAGGSYQNVAWSEYPTLFSDGHIIAGGTNATYPAGILAQTDVITPLRVLNIEDGCAQYVMERYPGLYPVKVGPGGFNGQTEEVQTVGYCGLLCANKVLPAEFQARLLEILAESDFGDYSQYFDQVGYQNTYDVLTSTGLDEYVNPVVWETLEENL